MRLLNTTTKQLESFYDKYIPQYAILSHTWGKEEDEVVFSHFLGSDDARREGEGRKGYAKIVGACKQAIEDGWEYIWIDTCCINKESSAELSEAINSMYKWYQNAEVCYVYLEDVHSSRHDENSPVKDTDRNEKGSPIKMVTFEHSRWFSRGWTLQELIAPQNIVFYSTDWIDIGTKASLRDVISTAARIRVEMLMAYDPKKASVAERMSWAACRSTTREEDMAYCLMGLFGVNMPLLYGEGNRAFGRLQEEIMKVSDDHSLFAWKGLYAVPDNDFVGRRGKYKAQGLLANSPWDFRDGMDIIPSDDGAFSPYSMTNQGLQIQLPLRPINPKRDLIGIDADYTKNVFKATLKCTIRGKQSTRWITVYLKMIRKGYYERVFPHLLEEMEINPNKNKLTSLLIPQIDTSATNDVPRFQFIRTKTLPTESGFTTKGHSLVGGYEDPDTYLSMVGRIAVTVFEGPEGRCFAVVIGFEGGVFWLDVVDIIEEWGHLQKRDSLEDDLDFRQAYKEGGRRHDKVLRRLDRVSVRIPDWSVVVSAKKFNNKNHFRSTYFCITVDIQRVPILARGWYTPPPTSSIGNFDGDLPSYLDGRHVVHPNFKKECSDWIAIFNPKAKREFDISPVHSIRCPNHSPSNLPGTFNNLVSCVRFSPDGKYLAVGCTNTIRVYDMNTGAETCVLFDEEDEIYTDGRICFSPDGEFIAAGAISGRIKLWDIKKGHVHKVIGDHQYGINSFCFSPDGHHMVSVLRDGTVRILDTTDETSEIFTTMDGPESLIRSFAISHNGTLVAARGWRDNAWIWNMATTQLVKKFEGYDNVVFTPDGRGLVIGGAHGLGYLDVGELVPGQVIVDRMEGSNGVGPVDDPRASGMLVQREVDHFPVTSIAVSHDGHWVVSGSYNGCVQFWNLRNATAQFMLQGHMDPVISVDMSPVGNIFATSSLYGKVRIWRYDTI